MSSTKSNGKERRRSWQEESVIVGRMSHVEVEVVIVGAVLLEEVHLLEVVHLLEMTGGVVEVVVLQGQEALKTGEDLLLQGQEALKTEEDLLQEDLSQEGDQGAFKTGETVHQGETDLKGRGEAMIDQLQEDQTRAAGNSIIFVIFSLKYMVQLRFYTVFSF